MLYEFHEWQRALLAPFTALNEAGSRLFSDPDSPFSQFPLARPLAAGYELLYRLGKPYEKPEWNLALTGKDGRARALTMRTVLELPFCRLLHVQRPAGMRGRPLPRVLLVAPLSGHHATLLRDTAGVLAAGGHDLYVTDWKDARQIPLDQGEFHLDDYVRYVRRFLQALGPDVHVISVCQPTVPVLAAISLMAADDDPCQPRSMVMMGGPIDARCSPTQVNRLATTKPHAWFEEQLISVVPPLHAGAGRRVYPGFLQHAGFVAMNPDRHLKSHYDFYLDLLRGDDEDASAHRRFYDEYNAVMDLPAGFYLDTIRIVFQQHLLPRGRWTIDGRRVRPAAIRQTALLTIEGGLDDISGPGQTRAALALCRGIPAARKAHYTAQGCGHYGIFSGRRWRETIYPKIAEFIGQA